jgi:hypothetical protein
MHSKNILIFFSGAVCSVALILSCSDDSPNRADAASCDCPLAEAPVTGRAMEFEVADTLPPANVGPLNGKGGAVADCPRGTFLLSGGCDASRGASPDIILVGSYPSSQQRKLLVVPVEKHH